MFYFNSKKGEKDLRKVLHFSQNKEKQKCFVDLHSKLYLSNPGPQHKNMNFFDKSWKDYLPKTQGLFLKKKRDTFTDECIRQSKQVPGPEKYPTANFGERKYRITGNYKK